MQDLVEMDFSDGKYVGQINSGKCRHGKGIFHYPLGDTYFGDWREDYFHGEGV
jgi:hypothetical protein